MYHSISRLENSKEEEHGWSTLGVLFVNIWHVAAEHSGISVGVVEKGKTANPEKRVVNFCLDCDRRAVIFWLLKAPAERHGLNTT